MQPYYAPASAPNSPLKPGKTAADVAQVIVVSVVTVSNQFPNYLFMQKPYRRESFWYRDAIIYELNIKGFYDSNNDGIGDFAGLEKKLDYLEELGVTAIWLLPFYPSPLRDDGYDIQDYYTVADRYGNVDDFKRFLNAAHERNLQVITELVINHTSDQHPWFQRARRAPKGSPERDYYVWSDTNEKWPDVRIIFTDTEESNWTWDPVAGEYYWHRFFSHQPDLNYDSPLVQQEIINILDYWMDMGIDGFRLDAIPYLFEREGTNGENLPETHAYLKKLRKHVDENYENVLFLAEANMWPEDSASYFGDGDECHMNYHFPLMPRMYMSVKLEDRHPITDIFDQTPEIPENCQWATFLRNHDELTLEMVTEEERDFMNNAYAADERARINVGIRRRLAPLMDNDHNKIKLLNVLLMSLPGTPVLYYGDEIGMGDNIYLKDRDGVRTPMQWNNNLNAGFSEANPHSLYMPVIRDTEYSYEWINVKRQEANPNSLLNWTKKLLNTRTEYKVFGRGTMKFLKPNNSHILAFVREHEQEKILVVINLSRHAQSTQLDLSEYESHSAHEVFGRSRFANIEEKPYQLSLSAHGYYWLKLEKIDTSRTDRRNLQTPSLNSKDFASFFSKRANRKQLTNKALPAYLNNASWMGSRADRLEYISIVDTRMQCSGPRNFGWMLLRLHFLEGMDELVQLPLSFYPGEANIEREAKIAITTVAGTDYTIVDALYDPDYCHGLLTGLASFGGLPNIVFSARPELENAEDQSVGLHHNGTEYAVLRSKDFILKYYRRISTKTVPDLEMKAWLSERDFPYSPQVTGSLHYQPDPKTNATLVIFENRKIEEGILASNYVVEQIRQSATAILDQLGKTEEVETPLNVSLLRRISDLGQMLANFHGLMHQQKAEHFTTEALSLHYQRSVYAGLKSDVRATLDMLKDNVSKLDSDATGMAEAILAQEANIHAKLMRIYRHKIEADKIRIHGDFTLEQLEMLGENFAVLNFDGDPDRPFSQRRLRRSPAKDLANLMRSISYASGLVLEELTPELDEDTTDQLELWLRSVSDHLTTGVLSAYREVASGSRLLPADEEDLNVLLDAFRIEKALQEVRYDLNYRLHQVQIPLRGLLELIVD